VQLPLAVLAGGGSSACLEAIADDEVLTCLHSLHDRGLVERDAQVHGASPTEYICKWALRRSDDLSRGNGGRPSSDAVTSRYACGDVELDFGEFVAYVNQRRVVLTAAQAELLSQLMNNQGRTLTREELARGADAAAGAHARSVDVQVARLRRKLAGARQFVIETVRGAGYRCVAGSAPAAGARGTGRWR
jgi:DNA-binding winged helix-turn-helix (wHTH) protein